jgi:hypothetical protein
MLVELASAWGKIPPRPGERQQRRGTELGAILNWGDGDSNHPDAGTPQAIRVIATLTREQIARTLLTVEEAWDWARAYQAEAKREDIDNVSAGPRGQLMQCIAKLLESSDLRITPQDCCPDELRYIHPPHPHRQPLKLQRPFQ